MLNKIPIHPARQPLSLSLPLLSYHIANAYNNPLTLFFFFLSYSRLSSPWDAAVVSLPGLPAETLDQLHPPPPHCRTLTLLHTLCQHLYAIYIIATTDMFLCSYSPYPCNPMRTLYTH